METAGPVRDQAPPSLVPQLLGMDEGSVPLSEAQCPETALMFLWMEAKLVPDGPADDVGVPLGPGRQTVGCQLGCEVGLPCQEWQKMVSPLLTRPPRDLGHSMEGLQF